MLTLIPVGNEGVMKYQRAAVALAFAGLGILVGEVASPYRDPWVGWIYRMVRMLTCLSPLKHHSPEISTTRTATAMYRATCSNQIRKHKSVQVDNNNGLKNWTSRALRGFEKHFCEPRVVS